MGVKLVNRKRGDGNEMIEGWEERGRKKIFRNSKV